MKDRSRIRDRFLRDSLPVRLGGLAANLARVRSFSDNPVHRDVVGQLLDESAWFIEWAAPEAPLETQAALLDCQRQLARWRRTWGAVWDDPTGRAAVAERAGVWSQHFVSLSGLVQTVGRGSKSHRA
jgi:hypothetical protein